MKNIFIFKRDQMQKYMNRYKRAQYKLGPTEGSFIFRILTIGIT